MTTCNWSRVQERAHKNEKKSASALRREFLYWLCSQDELRPLENHKQTSKMAFLEGPSGDTLLWDLSASQRICFWMSMEKAGSSNGPAAPDMVRPWTDNGLGRHSHLNTKQSFFETDACRITCETADKAINALRQLGFIRQRARHGE